MQNAPKPQHPSENDCCADDAVENAEEIDTPLSSMSIGGRSLCNLSFADDIDQLRGSDKELNERLEKTAAGYEVRFRLGLRPERHLCRVAGNTV